MRFNFISQRGFTLVEVLTVMLVLVAIASITVESTKDFVFQGRYDVTKDRYEKIKKAIIGDPNQVINGQPNIEGFVKDVGRLPFKLDELTDGYCSVNTASNFYSDSTACSTASGVWNSKVYLSSKEVLKDGWGNAWEFCLGSAIAGACYTNSPVVHADELVIQSKGKNDSINTADTGYDTDYPKLTDLPSIKQTDWTVPLNGLKVLVNAPYSGSCSPKDCSNSTYTTETDCTTHGGTWGAFTCSNPAYTSQTACINNSGSWQSYNAKPNCELSGKTWTTDSKQVCLHIKDKNNSVVLASSTAPETIWFDGYNHQVTFTTLAPDKLPQGKVLIALYEYDGSACSTSTGTAFGTIAPISITLSPNTTLPTINW